MNLIIPCDWKNINLITEADANLFGEALRGLCFVGTYGETGCYSTFEVNKMFKQVKSGKIYEEAKNHLYEDITPTVYHYKLEEKDCYIEHKMLGKIVKDKICDSYEIVMGWTWDGDGLLYFRFNDRKVSNSDCKKDYTWEWEK